MNVNDDDPGRRRLIALGIALAVGMLGGVVIGRHRRTSRERFDLDWRLAQDEDQIAVNTGKIDRAVSLLETVVDDASA